MNARMNTRTALHGSVAVARAADPFDVERAIRRLASWREHMDRVNNHLTAMRCLSPPRPEERADELDKVADQLAAMSAIVRDNAAALRREQAA